MINHFNKPDDMLKSMENGADYDEGELTSLIAD